MKLKLPAKCCDTCQNMELDEQGDGAYCKHLIDDDGNPIWIYESGWGRNCEHWVTKSLFS